MKANATFLTTPTVDTSGTSLLLHFDDKRYLIGNVHEGLQRICTESGTRLGRLTDLLLTGTTEWKNIGGVMGMILTLADVMQVVVRTANEALRQSQTNPRALNQQTSPQKDDTKEKTCEIVSPEFKQPKLTIHGGLNLLQTLATARRFIFRKGLPTEVNEYTHGSSPEQDWKPTWMDHNVRVWAMPINPELPAQRPEELTDKDASLISPLKRSFSSYSEGEVPGNAQETVQRSADITAEEQKSQILRGVVSDMFNSDWRLDALFETPLAEVKMPATIFVRKPETNKIEIYSGPVPGGDESLPDITVLVRKPWPGALVAELPRTTPSRISMSYIIRNHPQRGRFDPKKAKSLGIPEGNLFGILTRGDPVRNDKGETILPEQVLGEGKPGGGFAMIDLPSVDYVPGLITREEWKTQEVMLGVEAVVWNLGPGVANDLRLQAFIKGLDSCKHVISSPDFCANYLTMDSASAAAVRHNRIDPERFDIPLHDNRARALPEALSSCTIAHRGIEIQLEPEVKIKTPSFPEILNTAEVLQRMPKNVISLADAAKSQVVSLERAGTDDQDLPSPDTEIITLGTGSALPSKYRNVSGTLVRVPGFGSYLLDCGENTLGQLSRIYSSEELREVLRDLKVIWISHMHGDHHLGITSLIKAWYREMYGNAEIYGLERQTRSEDLIEVMKQQKRLFVFSEPAMIQWLREYSQIEDFGYDRLAPIETYGAVPEQAAKMLWDGVQVGFNTANPLMNESMQAATGLSDLAAVNVTHCYNAKAVSMTFPTGFKLSFSGDCRPSRGFAEIGRGSTVLIHEATFDDELLGDAFAKNHCTTSEAIGVGYAMGARRILLTHFSQRYQKLPKMEAVDNWELQFEDPTGKEDPASMAQVEADTTENTNHAPEDASGLEGGPPESQIRRIGSLSTIATDTKVAVAFDLMRIKVKDIALQENFTPAFVKLYDLPEKQKQTMVDPEVQAAKKQAALKQKLAKKAERDRHRRHRKQQSLGSLTEDGISKPVDALKTGTGSLFQSKEAGKDPASRSGVPPRSADSATFPISSPFQNEHRERRLGGGVPEDETSCSNEANEGPRVKRRRSQKQERRDARIAELHELLAKNEGDEGSRLHDAMAMYNS
ncbi:MAG: hypothetical protein LQ340_001244 [Diploschistes diacapsis]|nr:MAG: hypothetical protein LQ340_001244 [Diploschistes diacapsis]